ncbi:MAG: glycosyl transferase family protein [Massilia sp.]|nr:glycosyl transferase family protein [Massilia sp.]
MTEADPHYLVITMGSKGDVLPFMRVAGGLQALGRNMTFITHSYHAKLVEASGLPFIGLGTIDEYLGMVANPDLWDPRKGFAALMATYRDLLEQTNEAIQSVSTQVHKVVIAHPFVVPGAAIARECGNIESIVAAYLAPSNLRTCHDPLTIGPMTVARWVPMSVRRALWRYGEKTWIDPVAVSQINAARTPLGLPQVDSLLTHIADTADLSVTLFPSWFAPAVPDWPRPMISGDFPLLEPALDAGFDEDLSAFLGAGSRPLVFTPGTGNIHAADFFACALAAVERLGRRAIFLTGERAQVPAHLPASVLWQPYVTLSALLPHAAVMIHHGGIGTTSEALRAGTPQLITPFAWDQFDNGARVAALGAGRVIAARRLRPRALAASLETLATSAAIHARCARLAARFDPRPDPGALCTEIDRFVKKTMNEKSDE